MAKITPHLWYAKEAEEAARFYASIFPDSRVDRVTAMQNESPSGPPGSVKILATMMTDPGREKARRAGEAMMKMVMFDIVKLKATYEGKGLSVAPLLSQRVHVDRNIVRETRRFPMLTISSS